MQIIKIQHIIRLAVLFGVAIGFALAFKTSVRAGDNRAPDLPPICSSIEAPLGNRAFFRAYALGVQIYKWNGTTWELVAPLANLYADDSYRGQIGFHYAGPTWEMGNGKVVASRKAGCTPDATAIPWLLLQTVSTEGGVLRRTTYIQRVNTAGGLAPASPGTTVGAEVRVPYTAEYYFYRTGFGYKDFEIDLPFENR